MLIHVHLDYAPSNTRWPILLAIPVKYTPNPLPYITSYTY